MRRPYLSSFFVFIGRGFFLNHRIMGCHAKTALFSPLPYGVGKGGSGFGGDYFFPPPLVP